LSDTVFTFVLGLAGELGGLGCHRLGSGLARLGPSIGGEAGGRLLEGAPRPRSTYPRR
jgi:hypothetical protein